MWWKVEDVAFTDCVQDYLLRGVERGKGGVIYSRSLTLVVQLSLTV